MLVHNLVVTGSLTFPTTLPITGSLIMTGSIGIGTVSPTARLHISGTTGVLFEADGVNGVNALVVSSSGTVGVGGATNTYGFLDVWKSGGSIAQFSIGQSATYHTDFFVDTTGNFYIQPQGTTRFTISSAGTSSFSGNSLTSAADAATITLKQSSTVAVNGIYLERSGEQKGYYIYMGGAVDSLTFQRNNAGTKGDVMSLTRDGNVGIGTASPESLLHLQKASSGGEGAFIFLDNSAGSALGNRAGIRFSTNAGATFSGYGSFIEAVNSDAGNGAEALSFGNWNGSARGERMRIAADGNVLLNTTSTSTTNTSSIILRTGTGAYDGVIIMNHATTNNTGAGFLDCYYNTTYIGGIGQNGASNVAFYTSSDYRLKEDLKDFVGLNLISNLKVYDFKWKEEDSRMYGVIAHEAQEVIPYIVNGDKDEMKENGKMKIQVVDYSKLTPILIKAIQEQQATINALTTRITALEN